LTTSIARNGAGSAAWPIEHAFIVLLIAFSAFQFLFVVGATVG